jgi:integrase
MAPRQATNDQRGRSTVFTEGSVKRLPLPQQGEQIDYFQKLERGLTLALRISYGGTKSWRVLYYKGGKPRVQTIGRWPSLGVAAARKEAYTFDPHKAAAASDAGSFKQVAEDWIRLYVDNKGLRSKPEIERHLTFYVYPEWEKKRFFDIRRLDVAALLDRIVKRHGASQADCVLATLRSMMIWYQARDENYVSPIVRGMKRDKREANERARKRILVATNENPRGDDELRAVWRACDEMGTFGALVRLLLLTAQREAKVANLRWDDIDDNGVWTIPTEPREKGNAGKIKLPQLARDIIQAQTPIAGNPYVFTAANGDGPFSSFSQRKRELNQKLPADMPPWTLHDLRRTARSLMARAGVARDIAEYVLGHAIPGVEGRYNRHAYFEEKNDALEALANLINTILNPTSDNVVRLAAHR